MAHGRYARKLKKYRNQIPSRFSTKAGSTSKRVELYLYCLPVRWRIKKKRKSAGVTKVPRPSLGRRACSSVFRGGSNCPSSRPAVSWGKPRPATGLLRRRAYRSLFQGGNNCPSSRAPGPQSAAGVRAGRHIHASEVTAAACAAARQHNCVLQPLCTASRVKLTHGTYS